MIGINDKRKYEIVMLDELSDVVRITYPTKETFEWALSTLRKTGAVIIRSGLVKEK